MIEKSDLVEAPVQYTDIEPLDTFSFRLTESLRWAHTTGGGVPARSDRQSGAEI